MSHSGVALINPQKVFEIVKLEEGKRVADLGCGRTGHFVFPASKVVGEKGIVYAVDIMKDILVNIESRSKAMAIENIQSIWSDIESYGKTAIPNKSLDVCFFINSIFLMKDKGSAIKESVRLLKDKGYLVVVDWKKKIGPLGPSENMLVSEQEIVDKSNQCGLKLVENLSISDYHFCLIFVKG